MSGAPMLNDFIFNNLYILYIAWFQANQAVQTVGMLLLFAALVLLIVKAVCLRGNHTLKLIIIFFLGFGGKFNPFVLKVFDICFLSANHSTNLHKCCRYFKAYNYEHHLRETCKIIIYDELHLY